MNEHISLRFPTMRLISYLSKATTKMAIAMRRKSSMKRTITLRTSAMI
jgi:hypothetical protein